MMKKYIIAVLLVLGLIGTSNLYAQHYHYYERLDRKERKMDKKERKIHRKMWRDRPLKAARKEDKSRKKEYKMYMREPERR